MFDVAVFLSKISLLVPVFAAFSACAVWVYGAYIVIDNIDLSVAESLQWMTSRIVDSTTIIQVYHDTGFVSLLLRACGIEDAVEALLYLTTYLSLLSETVVAVLALLTAGIIAVWVYRKTKLACGVLSATGTNE